jgi:transcriptional regulator with XRE-family HTH domain
MDTLGQAIKHARITKRLKQKELVKATSLSQKYLSQIENDRVDPSFGVVQRIARALKISLDALKLEQCPFEGKEETHG